MSSRETQFNTTPHWDHQVYVFASNTAGEHSRGLAKQALLWGAKQGESWGPHGQTFAIPIWDRSRPGLTKPRSVHAIRADVERFVEYARINPQLTFFVTDLTYGITPQLARDIIAMFLPCVPMQHVWLPRKYWIQLQEK